jgi:hypothetical protein
LGSALETLQGKVLEWEARPQPQEPGQKGEGQGRGKRGPFHTFDGISGTSLASTEPELKKELAPFPLRTSKMKENIPFFPFAMRQRGGSNAIMCCTGVCERGKEIHPSEVASIVMLSRQDVGNKVISDEEPPLSENFQHVGHGRPGVDINRSSGPRDLRMVPCTLLDRFPGILWPKGCFPTR